MMANKNIDSVCQFLREAGTYYLATAEGDQPRVRPFGTVDIWDGKLTIQTGKKKDVSKQMHDNPKIEICAFAEGAWVRVSAKAVALNDVAAEEHMLDAYPELRSMYAPGDGNTEIFALTDATAVFSSFGAPPRTVKF